MGAMYLRPEGRLQGVIFLTDHRLMAMHRTEMPGVRWFRGNDLHGGRKPSANMVCIH